MKKYINIIPIYNSLHFFLRTYRIYLFIKLFIYNLLLIIYYLLFIIYYLLFIIYYLLFIIYYLLINTPFII